jgi:hypothetical protein
VSPADPVNVLDILGSVIGIHWTDLDEDISVGGLLGVPD